LLHVRHGSAMPPTGAVEEYPLAGAWGCTQMLEVVGMGTQEVLVLVVEVELALVELAELAEQV
jgi:hypothetical protein